MPNHDPESRIPAIEQDQTVYDPKCYSTAGAVNRHHRPFRRSANGQRGRSDGFSDSLRRGVESIARTFPNPSGRCHTVWESLTRRSALHGLTSRQLYAMSIVLDDPF